MVNVVSETHLELNQILRRTLATYREAEDLINIGAYVQGSNPEIDYAISKYPLIQEFIQQGMDENTNLKECVDRLQQIFGDRLEGVNLSQQIPDLPNSNLAEPENSYINKN